jgi:hypothetical protein
LLNREHCRSSLRQFDRQRINHQKLKIAQLSQVIKRALPKRGARNKALAGNGSDVNVVSKQNEAQPCRCLVAYCTSLNCSNLLRNGIEANRYQKRTNDRNEVSSERAQNAQIKYSKDWYKSRTKKIYKVRVRATEKVKLRGYRAKRQT